METSNWQAFNLATEALRDIDRYTSSKHKPREMLVSARMKLEEAVAKAPNYLRARYYTAVVDDMLGRPGKAAYELESILEAKPDFREEVEYNLAVTYYHIYKRPEIERAINLFQTVLEQTSNPRLKLLARAGLARSLSMMVLHTYRRDEREAQQYYEASLGECEAVLAVMNEGVEEDPRARKEIEWRVYNARGVARMFRSDMSDFLEDSKKRESVLHFALNDFREADGRSRNTWDIVCNFGSVHMRLGHTYKLAGKRNASEAAFGKALEYLETVLARLRPDYGFALYEMGRIYRLKEQYDNAVNYFEQAKAVPQPDRNVSDETLGRELERALRKDSTFP